MERKNYIDNIRWITVLLVILYHVIYIFNCSGVISNFDVQGVPQLDSFLVFVYPWFMALLFVVAGVSAKFSLQKRTGKEFVKDRAKRLLLTSTAIIFMVSWTTGWVTNQFTDMFPDSAPGVLKYFICCMCGIGPMWFAQELFLVSMVLLIVRLIDKKDKGILSKLGKKTNLLALALMVIPFWASSLIFNTPVIEVYRNGFYTFSFLLGYYVFSNDEVIEKLRKFRIPLVILAVGCGIAYTVYFYGQNYASMEVLKNPVTSIYAWIAILAVFACTKDWLNFSNKFSRYMTKMNFAYYALHYPILSLVAYFVYTNIELPMICYYIINLVAVCVLLPLVAEIISRIPVIRALLLGIYKPRKKAKKIKAK